jgi:1-deoxy-D-xylulose-5-phosphate synthase
VLEASSATGRAQCRIERLGIPDRFVEHGPRDVLLEELGLGAWGIAERVAESLASVCGAEGA